MKKIFFLLAILLVGCSNINTQKSTITLQAISDFEQVSQKPYVQFYIHKYKKALAVNAGKHKGKFAMAKATTSIPKGKYNISVTTLGETDGESHYKVFINDKLIGEKQNKPTTIDYQEQTLDFGKVKIKEGAVLKIAFSSHTNGKIPEGNGTAFSRGRWKTLILTPVK
ncbi:hypothetical protein [Wenyingzhuangia sp. IMCC45574]